jgi:hypothetical protein
VVRARASCGIRGRLKLLCQPKTWSDCSVFSDEAQALSWLGT